MSDITEKTVSMSRLPYVLPEWTRMIWTSETVRQVWEQKLQRASTAWIEIEERAVVNGLRDSALIFVDDRLFVEKSMHYAKLGFVLQPLSKVNKTGIYSASSSATAYDSSKPTSIRCALTTPYFLPSWIAAWENSDNRKIGELLGFPECCINFFQKVWIDEKFLDTTWPMFQNSHDFGNPHGNILLRWMGIRLVSHLPCSFDCESTLKIAEKNYHLMHQLGHAEEADTIIDLLDMPMEWSAKHGIAEIKTPLFKVSTRTDATSGLYRIQRPGALYPDIAPSGTKFPYQNTQKNLITASKSFKKSLTVIDPALEWMDNGFSSKDTMDQAHTKLLDSLAHANIASNAARGIDFGCGNGALLRKLYDMYHQALDLVGVEYDFDRAKRAQFNNPEFEIYNQDIWESHNLAASPSFGVISFNRLREAMEMDDDEEIHPVDYLMSLVDSLFVYSYDEELTYQQIKPLVDDRFKLQRYDFGYVIYDCN